MEPIQNATQIASSHVEHAEARGDLKGRAVQSISDSKQEARMMSSIVYTLATFIFCVSVYVGFNDRNWGSAAVAMGAAGIMGFLGDMMHKAVLATSTDA